MGVAPIDLSRGVLPIGLSMGEAMRSSGVLPIERSSGVLLRSIGDPTRSNGVILRWGGLYELYESFVICRAGGPNPPFPFPFPLPFP